MIKRKKRKRGKKKRSQKDQPTQMPFLFLFFFFLCVCIFFLLPFCYFIVQSRTSTLCRENKRRKKAKQRKKRESNPMVVRGLSTKQKRIKRQQRCCFSYVRNRIACFEPRRFGSKKHIKNVSFCRSPCWIFQCACLRTATITKRNPAPLLPSAQFTKHIVCVL